MLLNAQSELSSHIDHSDSKTSKKVPHLTEVSEGKPSRLTASMQRSYKLIIVKTILGDPGAVSRDDTMFVVRVYCKIETSPWALSLTEPVPEAFGLPASDWPEKNFSGQSTKRSSWGTLVFPYTT